MILVPGFSTRRMLLLLLLLPASAVVVALLLLMPLLLLLLLAVPVVAVLDPTHPIHRQDLILILSLPKPSLNLFNQ